MNIIIGIFKSIWASLKFITFIISSSILLFCITIFLVGTGTILGIIIAICYIISPIKWKIFLLTLHSQINKILERVFKLFISSK